MAAWRSLLGVPGCSPPQASATRLWRIFQEFGRLHVVAAALVAAGAAAEPQHATRREPASKAAAILTWPPAKREQYIAALDWFFLTRTVKAGQHAHMLDRGRPLVAFEAGGARAEYFDQFLDAERVRGVLVLQDGKIRLERYVSPHSRTTRWNSFSVAKSITSTLLQFVRSSVAHASRAGDPPAIPQIQPAPLGLPHRRWCSSSLDETPCRR